MVSFADVENDIKTIFDMTQAERFEGRELEWDDDLAERAQKRADDMCESGAWSHDGWTSYLEGRVGWFGENLAKDFQKADEVVPAWMDSAGHRANIIKILYRKVGVARGEDCNIYVQFFSFI